MNDPGYLKAIVLGVIQGITEFLPVSSSAHLALTQRWLALEPTSPALLLFDVFAHVATLLAAVIVFRAPILRFARDLVRDSHAASADPITANRSRNPSRDSGVDRSASKVAPRIVFLTLAATIPTAIVGLQFQATFEAAFDRPKWIGVCLLVTGTLLAALAIVPRGRRGWRQFGWWRAALVGLAQAGAILPGISRSGATICMASYLGLRRRWAAEFSFLIAAPAVLGGTLIKLRDTLSLPTEQIETIPWGPLIVGALASLIVGIVALRLLLVAVRRAKLHYFALYCWALGAVVLVTLP